MLDAVLERAGQWVPITDTGSVRRDLLGLAREIIANVSTPEMGAIIRAFVAEAPRESGLASRGREFWATRFADDDEATSNAIHLDLVIENGRASAPVWRSPHDALPECTTRGRRDRRFQPTALPPGP